jgi:hypothetical protein
MTKKYPKPEAGAILLVARSALTQDMRRGFPGNHAERLAAFDGPEREINAP